MNQAYGKPVDLFALGVVAYNVLSGYSPFARFCNITQVSKYDPNLVIRGHYDFHAQYWGHASDGAKQFIRALLEHDPARRLTADQALCHPWLTGAAPLAAPVVIRENYDLDFLNEDADVNLSAHSNVNVNVNTRQDDLVETAEAGSAEQTPADINVVTPDSSPVQAEAALADDLLGEGIDLAVYELVPWTLLAPLLTPLGSANMTTVEENWQRRWPLLQVLYGCGYLGLRVKSQAQKIVHALFAESEKETEEGEGEVEGEGGEGDNPIAIPQSPRRYLLHQISNPGPMGAAFSRRDVVQSVASFV